METIQFQGQECYVAYKALNSDMSNYQGNFKYKVGHWYSALAVDMSDTKCSYGCSLAKNLLWCVDFLPKGRYFKCYVPIAQDIKYTPCSDKFRCKTFYLANEVFFSDFDYIQYDLTDYQIDLLHRHLIIKVKY